jgi:hypothetical protein
MLFKRKQTLQAVLPKQNEKHNICHALGTLYWLRYWNKWNENTEAETCTFSLKLSKFWKQSNWGCWNHCLKYYLELFGPKTADYQWQAWEVVDVMWMLMPREAMHIMGPRPRLILARFWIIPQSSIIGKTENGDSGGELSRGDKVFRTHQRR